MSNEFRRVQYVKITDPAMGRAKGRAWPVLAWALDNDDNIKAVEVLMTPLGSKDRHTLWLDRSRWRPLYSAEAFILKVTSLFSRNIHLPDRKV